MTTPAGVESMVGRVASDHKEFPEFCLLVFRGTRICKDVSVIFIQMGDGFAIVLLQMETLVKQGAEVLMLMQFHD